MRVGTDSPHDTNPEAALAAAQRRIESLLDRCENTESAGHRRSILQEVARTYDEDLEDPDTALVVLLSALDYDYEFDPVASEIARLATELDQWADVLAERIAIAERLADELPEKAAAVWVRLARWYANELEQPEYAVEALRSALAVDETHRGALFWLAEILRERESWFELAEVVERQASAETDADTRRDLHLQLGALAESRLRDSEWAIAAYRAALVDEPSCADALDALIRIYGEDEQWQPLLDALATKADASEDLDERASLELFSARILALCLEQSQRAERLCRTVGGDRCVEILTAALPACAGHEQRADLHWQLGWVRERVLDQGTAAERDFNQALVCDPSHVASLRALASMYEGRGDWHKAANALSRAEVHVEDRAERLQLVLEQAAIHRDRLNNAEQAQRCCETALSLDRDNVDAARCLADIHYRSEKWRLLAPVLDKLLAGGVRDALDDEARAELHHRASRCARALGKLDRAVAHAALAYEAAPKSREILQHRADLLVETGDDTGGKEMYESLLAAHANAMPDSERGAAIRALGAIEQRRGNRERALHRYESSLLFDARNAEALEAIAALQATAMEWDAVTRAKRSLLAECDPIQREQLLREIAEIHADKRRDVPAAIAAYAELAELRPDDHTVLQPLLELYSRARMWESALDVIAKFTALESDALRCGKYYQAAATICRDELRDVDRAIDLFEDALDRFYAEPDSIAADKLPGCLKAFAAIDELLTADRRWQDQERAYRRMIKRMQPGDPVLGDLWHGLGEIYRSRLKKPASAIAAFEVAARLSPDNVQRREILAELYLFSGPDCADKAAALHLSMIARDPYKVDSYHALFRAYADAGRIDRAWSVARALVFLERADAEQRDLCRRFGANGPRRAQRRLTGDMWKRLLPGGAHRYLNALFGALGSAVASCAPAAKQAGLHGGRIDDADTPFAQMLDYAAQVLDVSVPPVHRHREQTGAIRAIGYCEDDRIEGALLVPRALLAGTDATELAFHCGRALTYLRPDHLLRVALSDDGLRSAFRAAMTLAHPRPGADEAAALAATAAERLELHQIEQLRAVVDRLLDSELDCDLPGWRRSIDATANRVGLVLCGDLGLAARAAAATAGADAVKELLLYSISDDHAKLREHLGIAVGDT